MRRLVFTLVLLLSLGWLATTVPNIRKESAPAVSVANLEGWRRTNSGWEQAGDWREPQQEIADPAAASLHPAVVAALQLLLSVGSLIAFTTRKKRRRGKDALPDITLVLELEQATQPKNS